jgi:predicted acetyltransferase
MKLLRPGPEHIGPYCEALERGWSADNLRGAAAAREELDRIAADPAAFLALLDDPQALGGPVTLPDGSRVARLPSLRRWMWDAQGFIGSIGLRWAAGGGAELPPHVLGHIGYAVVPWRRREGHATRALALLLPLARAQGLPWVDITTDPDNLASQRVVTANGGTLLGPFTKGLAYGLTPGLLYRITLD